MNNGHNSRAHAKLSASGSNRWINCPGSVRLEKGIKDSSSVYAEEGTLAHELGELKLRKSLGWISEVNYITNHAALQTQFPTIEINREMENYTDEYVDWVMEKVNEARAISSDATVILEQRLDFSHLVPDGFGTGDVVIIADGVLWVIDLKYGMRDVSAVDNSQLRLYGLGALNEYDCMYDVTEIRMIIIQPRVSESYSEEIMSADELIKYGDDVIKPSAELAASEKGSTRAGDWCMWCKVKATCRTRAEENLKLATEDFSEPELLTNEEMSMVLGKLKDVEKWVKHVKEYTLDLAINQGERYPGYKLVEGTSKRKYVDEIKVSKKLLAEGFDEDEIFQPQKLLGITAMEKVVGKKSFNSLLGNLVIKPPGSPTLVPASDKRKELNSTAQAEEDFKNIEL